LGFGCHIALFFQNTGEILSGLRPLHRYLYPYLQQPGKNPDGTTRIVPGDLVGFRSAGLLFVHLSEEKHVRPVYYLLF
jgi:hypothetical protein